MSEEYQSSTTYPAPLSLLVSFGVAGLCIGFFDALLTLFLGFGPGNGLLPNVYFLLIASVYNFTWGAALGAVSAIAITILATLGFRGWGADYAIYWAKMAIPLRFYGGLVLAGLWAILIFVIIFKFSPRFGFSLLGEQGFLSPLSPAMVMSLAAIGAAAGLVFFLSALRPTHRLALRFFWFVGLLLLGWQVFHSVYVVAYLPPTSFIHAAQTVVLTFLVAISLYLIRPEILRKSRHHRHRLLLLGAILVAMASPLIIGAAIERNADEAMRLTLHERTAISSRYLDISSSVIGRTPKDREPNCEPPMQSNPNPQNCESTQNQGDIDGVILIVIDTLRGDRLHHKRDNQFLMPNLRDFAQTNHEFEQAYASTASTAGSFNAIATGRIPSAEAMENRFAERNLSYALKQQEIWRGAIPSHTQINDFIEGFDFIDTSVIDTKDLRFGLTSEMVTRTASDALQKIPSDRPFFLLVHYYDPHAYYVENDLFDFGPSQSSRYDAEVAFTDYWLGQFLETIKTYQEDSDIAVIITADHGEEFFDHRYSNHGVRLYDESVRIPLVVDFPFDFDCELCTTPVSLADLTPTIISLFDVDSAPFTDAGALCLNDRAPEGLRPVATKASNRRGLIYGDYKLIENSSTGVSELYHLARDPDETNNLADTQPELRTELECLLDNMSDETERIE